MGKIATVGLATAVCGPIMGFSSSILASYWNSNPPKENPETVFADAKVVNS
jgi:BASS family bile acid:Na+ symporter